MIDVHQQRYLEAHGATAVKGRARRAQDHDTAGHARPGGAARVTATALSCRVNLDRTRSQPADGAARLQGHVAHAGRADAKVSAFRICVRRGSDQARDAARVMAKLHRHDVAALGFLILLFLFSALRKSLVLFVQLLLQIVQHRFWHQDNSRTKRQRICRWWLHVS